MATESTAPDPGLARTQRWMQAFIASPEPTDETAITSPPVEAEIPAAQALRMVRPSATLTSLERVSIYRDGYLARMVEALESDFPGLRHYFGEAGFYDLVAAYVDKWPSRSYTLNRLSDHLPEYLATRTDLPRHEFLLDLARLELALSEIFDAEESAPLSAEAVAAVAPEAWETARLIPVTAFRLMSFRYPVSEYLGGVDEENPFPALRRKNTWVVAYRRDYRLHRLNLPRPAFELLQSLVAGETVGAAVRKRRAVNQEQLFEWFREWMAEGLFAKLERGG
jgi:hypothetical protein